MGYCYEKGRGVPKNRSEAIRFYRLAAKGGNEEAWKNLARLGPLSVFLSKINSGEISLAFAIAVIYMVLPMLVFLYGEEYLIEGITYQGGVKG